MNDGVPSSYKRVGELACQLDSSLTSLNTTVVLCEAQTEGPKKGGQADGTTCFDIVCADSVLFPEGGGQPCDEGSFEILSGETPNRVEIKNVQRVKDKCVLSSPVYIPPGTQVKQVLNVTRRRDHMQHHSAQHLLSSIVEKQEFLGLDTVSWSLTHPLCFIVVDITEILGDPNSPYLQHIDTKEKKIKEGMISEIENECNNRISNHLEVKLTILSDNKNEFDKNNTNTDTRGRGIPQDVEGPIRLIDIHETDQCVCCGTHVKNLSELFAIKLLHQETKKNSVKIYFVTGDRLLKMFSEMFFREKQITVNLGGVRPEDFNATITERSKEKITLEKRCKKLSTDLAELEGEKLSAEVGNSKILVTDIRSDVDAEYYSTIRSVLDKNNLQHVIVISAWEIGQQTGQIMINGNGNKKEELEIISSKVNELLGGEIKGGISKMGYRGKGNIKHWDSVRKHAWS